MGRRTEGYRIIRRKGIWAVRFTHNGKRHEYSTGIQAAPRAKRPSAEADRQGQLIFAQVIQGKLKREPRTAHRTDQPESLAELAVDWLDDLAVREVTRGLFEKYTVYWLREWRLTSQLTEPAIAAYFRRRLREVTRKTANNEASALRQFLAWLVERGDLSDAPPVPTAPKGLNGKTYSVRRRVRAPDLSTAEVEALIAKLPERSNREGWPIRARFEVMWETTLRPATLDALSVPEHWAPGETVLRIPAAIDKEGHNRDVPLTPRAVAALESVAPEAGLIFGVHRFDPYVRDAASTVLPDSKAAILTGQHIRSAAITRWLERSNNLPGVMHLAGHRNAATTSRYTRPTFRAALDVIGSASIVGKVSGNRKAAKKKTRAKTRA